jgi:hypothetical protein
MEVAHLVARVAVAFVDANGFCSRVVNGWKREFDKILHRAAVAGAWICFGRRHW